MGAVLQRARLFSGGSLVGGLGFAFRVWPSGGLARGMGQGVEGGGWSGLEEGRELGPQKIIKSFSKPWQPKFGAQFHFSPLRII